MPHGAAYNQSLPNLTQHTKFSTRTIRTLKICRQSCIILHTNAPMHANMHTKNNLHADKTIINDHVIHIHSFTDRSRHTILSFTYTRIQLHTYISKSVYPIPERSVPMAGLLWSLKKLYEEPPFGAGAPSISWS